MTAYIIADVEVHDPDTFGLYRERVPAVIAQYGGRYLVRGGALHPVEGEWGLHRLVVLEFPSMDDARRFYDSPEYAPLLELRQASATTKMAIVEGRTPPG